MCVCDHTQESMYHSVINDLFHTLIIVVCVDHTQESMYHLVINDQFHTLIITVCVSVCDHTRVYASFDDK